LEGRGTFLGKEREEGQPFEPERKAGSRIRLRGKKVIA
jgi:hypothetical protein